MGKNFNEVKLFKMGNFVQSLNESVFIRCNGGRKEVGIGNQPEQ